MRTAVCLIVALWWTAVALKQLEDGPVDPRDPEFCIDHKWKDALDTRFIQRAAKNLFPFDWAHCLMQHRHEPNASGKQSSLYLTSLIQLTKQQSFRPFPKRRFIHASCAAVSVSKLGTSLVYRGATKRQTAIYSEHWNPPATRQMCYFVLSRDSVSGVRRETHEGGTLLLHTDAAAMSPWAIAFLARKSAFCKATCHQKIPNRGPVRC